MQEKKREFDYDLLPCVFSGRNKYYMALSGFWSHPPVCVFWSKKQIYICAFSWLNSMLMTNSLIN
jgi:hypothetical protein